MTDTEKQIFLNKICIYFINSLYGDDIMRLAGRPAANEQFERNRGMELRNKFKEELARNNMVRPDNSDFNNNRVDSVIPPPTYRCISPRVCKVVSDVTDVLAEALKARRIFG